MPMETKTHGLGSEGLSGARKEGEVLFLEGTIMWHRVCMQEQSLLQALARRVMVSQEEARKPTELLVVLHTKHICW